MNMIKTIFFFFVFAYKMNVEMNKSFDPAVPLKWELSSKPVGGCGQPSAGSFSWGLQSEVSKHPNKISNTTALAVDILAPLNRQTALHAAQEGKFSVG